MCFITIQRGYTSNLWGLVASSNSKIPEPPLIHAVECISTSPCAFPSVNDWRSTTSTHHTKAPVYDNNLWMDDQTTRTHVMSGTADPNTKKPLEGAEMQVYNYGQTAVGLGPEITSTTNIYIWNVIEKGCGSAVLSFFVSKNTSLYWHNLVYLSNMHPGTPSATWPSKSINWIFYPTYATVDQSGIKIIKATVY